MNFGKMENQQLGTSLPEINSDNGVRRLTLHIQKFDFQGCSVPTL
jgi:hypothetical protein